ncbi:MAG TPA: hypothetical protein EYG79_09390, partial [Rhodobacteraceae bacterium]|nr:hypothetical protein [Paracoccaceae bacterium]
MKILVDACIFEHSLSFKGAWQNHGVQLWGNKLPVETGGIITKYAGKTIKASKGGDQNCALGALAVALSQPNNGINGYTTDALRFEQWHLGGNKFKETKYGDVQLFKNVKLEKIRTLDDSFTFQIPKDDVLVKLREYIGIQVSPLLKKVIDNLNQVKPSNKSSQDAWHITCMIERK